MCQSTSRARRGPGPKPLWSPGNAVTSVLSLAASALAVRSHSWPAVSSPTPKMIRVEASAAKSGRQNVEGAQFTLEPEPLVGDRLGVALAAEERLDRLLRHVDAGRREELAPVQARPGRSSTAAVSRCVMPRPGPAAHGDPCRSPARPRAVAVDAQAGARAGRVARPGAGVLRAARGRGVPRGTRRCGHARRRASRAVTGATGATSVASARQCRLPGRRARRGERSHP